MNHNFSAKGKYIELSPMDYKTIEQYRKIRNREDNRKYFFSNIKITQEQQEKWFNNYLKDDKQIMFSIHDVNSKEFIGGIGFYDLNEESKSVEIGRIILDKKNSRWKRICSRSYKTNHGYID